MKQEKLNSLKQKVEQAARVLNEHFESVVIHVTLKNDESNSYMGFTKRAGNYYANYGVSKLWVEEQEEDTRIDQRDWRESQEDVSG